MAYLLRVRDLHVRFTVPGGTTEAVKGVSFRINPGSTVALVGESGSGKSVISQAVMGILPRNGRITEGEILFADPRRPGTRIDLAKLAPEGREYRSLRGGRMSMIFQEPMTSLNADPDRRRPDDRRHSSFISEELAARSAASRLIGRNDRSWSESPIPARTLRQLPTRDVRRACDSESMIAMALVVFDRPC